MHSAGLQDTTVADPELGLTFPAVVHYPSPVDGPPTRIGPYLLDAARDVPIADGVFPLVVLSHGSGGSHLLYHTIATHLARAGFVVVAPEHPGNNRRENTLHFSDENIMRRVRHLSLTITAMLSHPLFGAQIDPSAIAAIGHSIGGTSVLAMAGGVPWSRLRVPIAVQADARVRAGVLLAPSTEWYQAPESLAAVRIPLLVYVGALDDMTPPWQSELVTAQLPQQTTLRVVDGAGHYSFLSPFPAHMRLPSFPPAHDPDGFDREAFHAVMPAEIASFLRTHLQRGATT